MQWRSSMRRLQAIFVFLTLLAIPFTVMACVDSCVQTVCPCCASMSSQGQGTKCRDMTGKGDMSGRGQTQQPADFLLAARQARSVAVPFAELPEPPVHRVAISTFVPSLSSGFIFEPFHPPRS